MRAYRKVGEGEFHEVDVRLRRRRPLGSHDVCIVAARHEWLAVRHRLLHGGLNPPRSGRVQTDLWLSSYDWVCRWTRVDLVECLGALVGVIEITLASRATCTRHLELIIMRGRPDK